MENNNREEETYKIIGLCMEVYRNLGPDLLEVVYKDALEIEFTTYDIPFVREREFKIEYKGNILKHNFFADFVVFDDIILELKAVKEFCSEHIARTLNYIRLSNSGIGLLVNF